MKPKSQSTAILFFSNSVEAESKRKLLLTGGKNKDFIKAIHAKSLQTLKSTNYPVFEILEDQQRGNTFGERISNAFDDVFSKGFQNVICVGSDCPELDLHDINKAAQELSHSEIVLGPDFRGGLFLIAINKAVFQSNKIASLNWNQPDLIDSFIAYGISYNMHFLEAKFDLNLASEIGVYSTISPELLRLLKLLIRAEVIPIYLDHCYLTSTANSEYLRGPPNAA